ncbi:NEDD8-activating enzyme E1 regulatory subunit [Pochonia chlamydosporia 170]|uniref:NEDD8-activating enzyme E1 regulatory subunit n=1 Tax=Pochonia chlamydosporia 170 TaxID=1380566 RepID=A0A179FAX0_METCM|nr:NEDD8-activating enzyme E1 regulatory subunit [Pochonia chlamydosporia 170]OAQ62249.1 NEDD8-activating enzyme E1 regulatory subunit [Pochonia chlamydosporia 170]
MPQEAGASKLTGHGPTDKERRYDRQLRLWAASGQAALETANVLLVNASSGTVGVEVLKNLVLPGLFPARIGKFVIADEAIVRDEDLGVNFFLDEDCLGKPRALCCVNRLVELNPEVSGDWYPKEDVSSLEQRPAPLDLDMITASSGPFTIIAYTLPLHQDRVCFLETYARQQNIPLLSVCNVGYYSYFTLKLPGDLPIVDTHPDGDATADLRLLDPWPELSKFSREMTQDIDNLDDHDHGHLPLVVILLHYLEKWKSLHSDALPLSYSDKVAFRSFVADGARRDNPEGGEENFEEAVSAVMKHVNPSSLPRFLEQVFDYIEVTEVSPSSPVFHYCYSEAVRQFYQKHSQLPLQGGVPDMKAQSSTYMKLQSLYKAKARQDISDIVDIVRTLKGGGRIARGDVELFCKNAKFIKLVRSSEDLKNDELSAVAGPEMPTSLIHIYLALRASFIAPTESAEEITNVVTNSIPSLVGNQSILQAAREIVRSNRGEIHNTAAVTGGMVSQEMIKLITRQYIPIDNTCIFDGIESRSQVLRLNLSKDHLQP